MKKIFKMSNACTEQCLQTAMPSSRHTASGVALVGNQCLHGGGFNKESSRARYTRIGGVLGGENHCFFAVLVLRFLQIGLAGAGSGCGLPGWGWICKTCKSGWLGLGLALYCAFSGWLRAVVYRAFTGSVL